MGEVEIVFWYWWILAAVMLIIELLAPGFFFLWFALAAFVVGSLLMIFSGMALELQGFLFSVLAVTSILIWRRYFKAQNQESDHPFLNQRGAQYIGRTFNLIRAIENGEGKISIDGTLWKVHGEDCPVGSKVKIVAAKGTTFDVESS